MESVKMPPGLYLQLGDVQRGSSTPSMASKVMDWKKQSVDGHKLFEELDAFNLRVIDCFQKLEKLFENNYERYNAVLER